MLKSNWERYFQEIVDCSDDYILKRWEKLYDLRCKIAHNNTVIESDFDQITKLTGEVKDKLENAIDKLAEITISETEKEDISLNFAITKNNDLVDFFKEYNKIRNTIKSLEIKSYSSPTKYTCPKSIMDYVKLMQKDSFKFQSSYLEQLDSIQKFRNNLIHNYNSYTNKKEIIEKISTTLSLSNELDNIIKKNKILREVDTKDKN